jgi:5-methylthioadenosine/S-adenosylhomocysteine deaminase
MTHRMGWSPLWATCVSALAWRGETMKRTVHKRVARSLLTMLLAGLTTHTSLAQDPSRTLLRNANLVITMEPTLGDGALGLIANGDVLIEGDRIAAVGQGLDGSGARTVDATGKIV